jgi:hypothetical protein
LDGKKDKIMLADLKIETIAIIVLIIWNIFVFAMYGLDKQKAKQRKRRISEETLILSALLMPYCKSNPSLLMN